jgi:hypothetical protein
MKKYLLRMRMRQDKDKRVVPMVWNRWRQYTGMRKLLKYQMRQIDNYTNDVRADL